MPGALPDPRPPDCVISVSGLTVQNPAGILLENISFNVYSREIVVILGASGCGKSTLLKHLIGLYEPAAGQVLIGGRDLFAADDEERSAIMRGFGVLYQSAALLGSLTVIENVLLPLQEHSPLSPETMAGVARRKLAIVGLAGFEDYLPDGLSGGMRKRAGLARALALNPPLLFLDEPSAGLDPVTSAGLDRLILELRNTLGTTLVIVSHELDSIFAIADRTLVLRDRRIVADGPPREIARSHPDPWVREFFSRAGTKAVPQSPGEATRV